MIDVKNIQTILVNDNLNWDRIAVTWGSFDNLPASPQEAQKHGWTLFSSCNNANALWPGNMYVLKGDLSTIPIYDQNGILAGIQVISIKPGF